MQIYLYFTVFLESCSMRTLSLIRTVSNVQVVNIHFVAIDYVLLLCVMYTLLFFSALVKFVVATNSAEVKCV